MRSAGNKHRPFHIYDGCGYFITGRIYNRIHLFNTRDRKQIFIKRFSTISAKLHIGILAWSLLPNHYHAIIKLPPECLKDHSILPNFFRFLHAQTGSILNQIDNTPSRKVWYQYWDYCIRNEPDFWRHFNYIVQQPLKHGLVKSLVEAFEYPYSSNPVWMKRFGKAGLSESMEKFPVRDWTPSMEDSEETFSSASI